jgi:homoserine/homoserine lactone efflux protein
MDLQIWTAFFLANLCTSLLPGPGAAAAMNAGLAHGVRAGLRLVAGLQLALLLQLSITALGVGALLLASERALQIFSWGGAAYLVGLGIAQWRAVWQKPVSAANGVADVSPLAVCPAQTLLWRGMWVNLSNPKAILFQAALVPHFISPARPLAGQYVIIAVTMCAIDSLVMSGYVNLAARLRPWFSSRQLARWRNLLFGALFIGFGLALLGMKRMA